jgi:hypothetical protein
MNIIQAFDDANVFGEHFRDGTWDAWRTFLAALFALPLTPEQLDVYRRHTGRSAPPTEPAQEAWLVCGRRAGKSLILATIAVFLAAFCDWRRFLGPGELATIMIIARDRRQARVIKRFITGLLHATPMLRRIIENETADSIRLRNRVAIEIHTASFRSTRGYTIVAALLDEIAFWPTDEGSAEPDIEVINAIKPGMATIPKAMLLCASSPHARRGALWDAYRKHFGKDGDPILVWQAATRDMNSSVPQSFIDAHMADDPARAQAEYLAQFRTDVEGFVSPAIVEACVGDFHEMSPMAGFVYSGFVDPSGGSDAAMTLAIGHKTTTAEKQIVIDVIREVRPPFDPVAVVDNFAALLKTYRISKVLGDHYGGEFVKDPFRKQGINYEVCKTPKSDLFRDLLPLLNSRQITLPQHNRLIAQIVGLERRVSRAGKDSIAHAPQGQDDLVNAVAGCAAALHKGFYDPFMGCGDDDDPDGRRAWQAFGLWQHIRRYG